MHIFVGTMSRVSCLEIERNDVLGRRGIIRGELLSNLAKCLDNAGIDNIVGLIECNKYSTSEIKFWKINHIKSSSNEFGQFKILCVLFCISSISNLKQYAINIEARATLKQSSHSL